MLSEVQLEKYRKMILYFFFLPHIQLQSRNRGNLKGWGWWWGGRIAGWIGNCNSFLSIHLKSWLDITFEWHTTVNNEAR